MSEPLWSNEKLGDATIVCGERTVFGVTKVVTMRDEYETELAKLRDEYKEFQDRVKATADKILFMPTWVDADGYKTQVDMRRRCYEEVCKLIDF